MKRISIEEITLDTECVISGWVEKIREQIQNLE